jgi:VWFA-related protein
MRHANSGFFMPVLASCLAVHLFSQAPATASQSPPSPAVPEPALVSRPASVPEAADGRIKLDVVVTGKQGSPVSGLELKDFTILDNKKAQTILGFHVEAGSAQARQMSAEVILVLDAVNSTFQQAAFARQQTAKFLAQNGGHLAYPTTIAMFSTEGLRIQPRPSSDGNALAAMLDQASAGAQSVGSGAGSYGEIGRFQLSVKTLAAIAENEARKPGRKMLIWIGPGWPMLVGPSMVSSAQDRQRLFDVIVELSTRLREAHIALYAVSPINPAKGVPLRMAPSSSATTASMVSSEAPEAHRDSVGETGALDEPSYKEFLKGVKFARQMDSGNLSLQVVAIESGGRVLSPSNDLEGQIADCLADLNAFYTISFDPPHAEHADEYHELKVIVNKPGLTARTNTGYYNQP